jgi:hypothetical protein
MKLFLVALTVIGISIALIAIKMFIIKGGTFTKQCASVDLGGGEKVGCTCGEKAPEDRCKNYEAHHGSGYDGAKRKIVTIPLKKS